VQQTIGRKNRSEKGLSELNSFSGTKRGETAKNIYKSPFSSKRLIQEVNNSPDDE
jgi:hypothetical protein